MEKILEEINFLSLNGISFVREEVETHVNFLSCFREQYSFSERLLEELKEARDTYKRLAKFVEFLSYSWD